MLNPDPWVILSVGIATFLVFLGAGLFLWILSKAFRLLSD